MDRQDEVRIPPKRLRLVGIFAGSFLGVIVLYLWLGFLLDAIERG